MVGLRATDGTVMERGSVVSGAAGICAEIPRKTELGPAGKEGEFSVDPS